MEEDEALDLRRLRWQCRRGMLELDLLLERFLARRYPQADAAERRDFSRLLRLPDQTLSHYLLHGEPPDDPRLAALVRRILACR